MTKFIKVAVKEEKPQSTGFYWIENIVGEMKSSYYDSLLKMFTGDFANFWLKPVPDNESALIKRNEELEAMLESARNEIYQVLEGDFAPFPLRSFADRITELLKNK